MLTDFQMRLKEELKKLLLSRNGVLPFSDLERKAVGIASLLVPELTPAEVDEVVTVLTEENTVTLTPSGTVVDPKTFVHWLADRQEHTPTPRWDAYEQLLVSRDWEEPVIRSLATQTDEVVELLGDPLRPGSWARRGLLMGEVQSGKTATYIGLLNKALDYGYRVVIVIGGHTNELRRQTQARFDTDLLGIDSEYLDDNIANAKLPQVGIGLVDSALRANVMTTVRGDFGSSKKSAGITWVESELPTVFVIKKNAKLIANVTNYIRQQAQEGVLDIPLIVIDDEADWGTPNTGSDTDPTRVNKEVRKLLGSSRRSTYLGITATPFANIFIDDAAVDASGAQDLFPSDYIRVMSAPNNYLGIGHYFRPPHTAVRTGVDDCLELIPIQHKSTHRVGSLPRSLQRAIVGFLLGTAIRRLRDKKARPASMMVNISRFNDVQIQVSDLVLEYLDGLVAMILAEMARKTSSLSSNARWIEDVWREDFDVDPDLTWADVKESLVSIAPDFRVDLVNSRTANERSKRRKLLSTDQRKAEDLLPTIFVGGDVLSRGLTLEGLQVSYFVREPRTMDTLMQMGRWFGYRPRFSDLVQVWVPESTANDFEWSAEVTEELRELLLEMKARKLTPRDFGLRVRTHPEGFNIVAAKKRKSTEVVYEGQVLWENKLAEAWKLSANLDDQRTNREALKDLVLSLQEKVTQGELSTDQPSPGYLAWRKVPIDYIYEFFRRFRGHSRDPFWGSLRPELPAPISDALQDAKGSEFWDVVVVSGSSKVRVSVTSDMSVDGNVRDKMSRDGDLIIVGNRRVATPQNLVASLSTADKVTASTRSDLANWPSQAAALHYLSHPVLLLFALVTVDPHAADARYETVEVDPELPLISAAVAFPKLDPEIAIELAGRARKYVVNAVWLRNLYGYTDDGDDVLDEYEDEF
jgi:hypothetical protein